VIPRNALGEVIPAGRIRRERVESFLPDRTAGWTELGTGSSGHVLGNGSAWFYGVGNPGGGTCLIRSNFDIALGALEEVAFTVEGFHASSTSMGPGLGLKDTGASRGVGIWCPAGATSSTYRAFGSGQPDQQVPYTWSGTDLTRRRNLTLVLRPRSKDVCLMEDDQVVWAINDPTIVTSGTVRAVYDSGQGGITDGEIRMAQLKLAVVHN
jgi:hypothetical protein